MFMPGDSGLINSGTHVHEFGAQLSERQVLRHGVRYIIATFQFNTNTKIVAAIATIEVRNTCVPGTVSYGGKLSQFPFAINKKVRRYAKVFDLGNLFVVRASQTIAEKGFYTMCSKLSRWKTDAVNNQQINLFIDWSCINIRRIASPNSVKPTISID